MPCFLGIDYGGKRIGLAVSDAGGKMALPLTTLQSHGTVDQHAAAVLAASDDFDIEAFVVGLPLNMDGTEGKQAKLARRFGAELQRASRKPVHFADERLSSQAAAELLRPAGLTRKKRKHRLDRIAAKVMLQDFLDSRL